MKITETNTYVPVKSRRNFDFFTVGKIHSHVYLKYFLLTCANPPPPNSEVQSFRFLIFTLHLHSYWSHITCFKEKWFLLRFATKRLAWNFLSLPYELSCNVWKKNTSAKESQEIGLPIFKVFRVKKWIFAQFLLLFCQNLLKIDNNFCIIFTNLSFY